jgi:hypothetical protein
MSTPTLPGATPEPAAAPPRTAGAPAIRPDARFPRPAPDPQDDWPLDVHLPDALEDDEC